MAVPAAVAALMMLPAEVTPSPGATPGLAVDPQRVTPGLLGFLSFVFLIIAVVILYFSLRKQLKKVNFDENALPAGVKRLPTYATAEARRASAAAFEARRAAGPPPEDSMPAGFPAPTPPPTPPAARPAAPGDDNATS
ncbi:MAG: hypothetical protein QG671_1223 [Actinomycetota bacterium]|nr:hypothetical protein [Actinomycetota bacterium]